MQIGTAAQFVGDDDARARRHIDIATRTLDSCREELRNCIWDLRSNTLDEKNLGEAVRRTVQRLVGGATLRIWIDAPRDRLSDNAVHALVNVVRELATNAVRHGGASTVSIRVSLDGDTLAGSVEDDGCGFDPKSRPGVAEGHFGLQGVEERLDELGGELSIESRLGKGTKVSFRIPVQPIAAN
jgi:signal transduction histidine kinase